MSNLLERPALNPCVCGTHRDDFLVETIQTWKGDILVKQHTRIRCLHCQRYVTRTYRRDCFIAWNAKVNKERQGHDHGYPKQEVD